ncbi:hypothetical protein SAMN06272735_5440 [Streptomyces sp. TLI_55]|uniref:hypothetical protein n=1 Tax=Streptomyces sp. TLI_55 TaxID=1938861 RepID=UPI000BD698D2|nr:hypothetical protein [Streptomyces sp. TLI_55]SNX63630.1 hypothetical protein SAMN06272735_5440 [Streptomyces sp. TLI_55]
MTMLTDTQATAAEAAMPDAVDAVPQRLFGSRGRHRRPRPRKVLLAVGGLAVAAGALSLVRMAPEGGLGGALGTAEAEPRLDDPRAGSGTDRATNAAATVVAIPKVSPSATAPMGGASATPTSAVTFVPVPSSTPAGAGAVDVPGPTTIPDAPNPTSATPQPTQTPSPAPSQSTYTPPPPATPTPQPTQPGGGVCVPVIGLCVGPLGR